MTGVMTPSKPITKGQAGKFCDVLADALVKSGLPSELTQQVLEGQGAALADEFVGLLRNRVEAVTGMVVRRVKVDRACSNQTILDATGRVQYVSREVVNGMPVGEGDEAEVCFFPLNRWVSDDELAKEYDLRGLKPDPRAQAAVNAADPTFADKHPNGTHWKNADGKRCFATFDRWNDERDVRVGRGGSDWDDYWFFGGVRK